jgi:hypothetical protein
MENMMTKHGIKNYETTAFCPHCEEVTKFEVAQECYCHVDFDGCGYTYQDEHSDCDFCMGEPFCCKGCEGSFAQLPARKK